MSARDQANYIFYEIVMHSLAYLAVEFQELLLLLDKALTGVSENPPRWKTCVSKVSEGFPVAVSAMYVKAFLSPADKTAAEDIVKNLMSEFKKLLTEEDWMDLKTRTEENGQDGQYRCLP